MTIVEIHELLRENVNRIVYIVWDDGENEDVKIISVDDEGFVYDLVPPDPKTHYRNRLEDVTNVVPQALA